MPSLRAQAAPYDIGFRSVAGPLPRRKRKRVLRALSRPLRTWVDVGFVAGPWPRNGFGKTFAAFNRGATPMARRNARLLTMKSLGPSLVEVVPRRRRIRISATAVKGRVVGATASVDLRVLGVDEDRRRARVNVRGDLYLTYVDGHGWRIFGYDLDRWVDTGTGTGTGTGTDARGDG